MCLILTIDLTQCLCYAFHMIKNKNAIEELFEDCQKEKRDRLKNIIKATKQDEVFRSVFKPTNKNALIYKNILDKIKL